MVRKIDFILTIYVKKHVKYLGMNSEIMALRDALEKPC